MGDVSLSFADQAKQLLADFQSEADCAAPITPVMMYELKALLDIGAAAVADCDRMTREMTAATLGKPSPTDGNAIMIGPTTAAEVSTEGTKP